MCNCLSIFARVIIAIFSLIFTILGLGLLVIGVIVKVQSDTLQMVWAMLISMATSQAKSAVGDNISLPANDINIDELVGGLAIVFIVLGVVMCLIGIFGLGGACCMVKCMIIGYLVVLAAMTIGMLIVVIILAANRGIITDPPKAGLKTTLQTEYQGLNGSDITSLLWNTIMTWQQCCGIDSYKDFNTAPLWKNIFGPGTTLNFQVPAACCKSGAFNPPDRTCTTIISTNSNKDTGCYDKLISLLLDGSLFIGFSCGTICFFALFTFFSAVMLYTSLRKNKVSPE